MFIVTKVKSGNGSIVICMQDTFARELVYKIPYRRAPLGRVRARAKVSCIQLSRAIGLQMEVVSR